MGKRRCCVIWSSYDQFTQFFDTQARRKGRKKIWKLNGFHETVVEGIILSVSACRNDELLIEIVRNETSFRVEQFLFRSNGQFKPKMMEVWKPIIEMGRRDGLVRLDLEIERILELIRRVHSMLLIRNDYDEVKQRAFVLEFLLPALRP